MSGFIATKGSLSKSNENFQIVKHESYKSKRKSQTEQDQPKQNQIKPPVKDTPISMKRMRNEIIKFGISGFSDVEKKAAKVQYAIKLGAKPPKRKPTNYKELIAQRKEEKRKQRELASFQQLGKTALGKSDAVGKKFKHKLGGKREIGGLLKSYGGGKVKKTW